MKIRKGYVSNSSSSSFIIGVKGSTLKAQLKELEKKEKKVNGLFSNLVSDAVRVIAETAAEFSEEDVLYDYGYDTIYEFYKDEYVGRKVKSLLDKGFKVYMGEWCDDGGQEPIESVLCNMDLNYKSDKLVIIHDGGY